MEKFEMVPTHVKWSKSSVTAWTPYHENGQTYNTFAKHEFKGLWDVYARAEKQFADLEFLVHDKRRYTFKQLFAEVAAMVSFLENDAKCKPGDRVAVVGMNSIEWIIAFVAASYAGMVAVPMNSWWTGKEMAYGLSDSGAKIVFADEERIKRMQALPKGEIKARVEKLDAGHFAAMLKPHYALAQKRGPLHARPAPTSVDEGSLLMYTSGTTAHPKGVLLTHRGTCHLMVAFDASALMQRMMSGETNPAQNVILLAVPLFHATGMHAIFLSSFVDGRKIVLMNKWNPETALEIIERERVSMFTGVPTMVQSMLASPDLAKRDVSSLKLLSSGGAAAPAGVAKAVSEKFKGTAPGQGFGLTEVNAVATIHSGDDYLQHPTSCGKPIPGIELAIWPEDKDDAPLPVGATGRIMIRGVQLMREYWNQPQATAKAITASGWFDSGDLGYLSEDGFLFINGRAKDIIIRGGENISARTVEEAVYAAFPSIAEASVFGIPHEMLGEQVALAIVMKKGQPAPKLADFRKKLVSSIAQFELPAALAVFRDELPRGATGKIVKRDIRNLVTANQLQARGATWERIDEVPGKAKL